MDQTMVTAADLANVINNAGRALDWTRSYRNVAGTTIGAERRTGPLASTKTPPKSPSTPSRRDG